MWLFLSIATFIIALIAAVFGFTNIAAAAAGFSKLVFIGFLALFVICVIAGMLSAKRKRR